MHKVLEDLMTIKINEIFWERQPYQVDLMYKWFRELLHFHHQGS